MSGNKGVDVETRLINDNSIVVENVHSINSVTNARRSNICLERNAGDKIKLVVIDSSYFRNG